MKNRLRQRSYKVDVAIANYVANASYVPISNWCRHVADWLR